MVLIVSSDTVGPALLAGLVETLECRVSFSRPGERVTDALRKERPGAVLIDASDPQSSETLGHAHMLGVPAILFGGSAAVERVRATFADRPLSVLAMPLRIEAVQAALQKSLADG